MGKTQRGFLRTTTATTKKRKSGREGQGQATQQGGMENENGTPLRDVVPGTERRMAKSPSSTRTTLPTAITTSTAAAPPKHFG